MLEWYVERSLISPTALTTILIIRAVFSLIYLLLARYLRVVSRRGEFSPFVLIAGIFLIRDVIVLLSPTVIDLVDAAAIAATYLIFLRWTGGFRRSNRSFHGGIAFSLAVAVILFLDFLWPGNSLIPEPLLLWSVPVGMIVLAFIGVSRIDRYTSRRGYEIEILQPWLQSIWIILGIIHVVQPVVGVVANATIGILDQGPTAATLLFLFHRHVVALRDKNRSLRRNAQSIFGFLSGVGRSVFSERSPDAVLRSAIDTMVDAADADAGIAIVTDGEGYRVCAVNGLFPPPTDVPAIIAQKQGALSQFLYSMRIDRDTPIWGDVLFTGKPRLIARATGDSHYAKHAVDRVFRVRSVQVLPLKVRGTVLGALSVLRRDRPEEFSQSDFDHARTMADFVAVTLDNYFAYIRMAEGERIQRDIEIAGEIQSKLQATIDSEAGGIESSAVSRPARGVGGDYYDVLQLENGKTAVLICDVSGKGVPAALVMVMVRTIAHLAFQRTDDAGIVLERINEGLNEATAIDRFATASIAVFDPDHDRLSYANAGHHPMLVCVPESPIDVREVDSDGLPIGIEPDGGYTTTEAPFPPGATAVFYTDGVVEAIDTSKSEYGIERTTASIRSAIESLRRTVGTNDGANNRSDTSAPLASRVIIDSVVADLDRYVGDTPQHDDITLVVCRRSQPPTNAGGS